MANITKGSVIFKHKPEDFIVEEVLQDYTCNVSHSIQYLENHVTDFQNLDLKDRRDFLMCELEKINIDHFNAISILSKELNNLQHEIGFAGTKDKIAWTCQRISIFNADLDRIKQFQFPGMILKNFKWIKHKIKIGDLVGNKFNIVLRDADSDALKILNRVRNTQQIPNFFGVQRFGSLRQDNVKIGKLILQSKFKEAIFALLSGYGDSESEEVIRAKLKFKSEKNIEKAKEYFPINLRTEHNIIDSLLDYPNDWLKALQTIDKKVLLLMCQSVQSKIFNDVLDRCIDQNIEINNSSINLLGYDSSFSPGDLGFIEQDVLKEHSLDIENFNVPEIPFLSLKGAKRKAFFEVKEMKAETQDDELFPHSKKIVVSFLLDSGVYATTLLEHFFVLR